MYFESSEFDFLDWFTLWFFSRKETTYIYVKRGGFVDASKIKLKGLPKHKAEIASLWEDLAFLTVVLEPSEGFFGEFYMVTTYISV